MAFEIGDDANGLRIMIEPAIGRHQIAKRILARMAKGRVAQIMGQRNRLGQILVRPKGAGNRAGHLRDLD